uniref:Uncharacterized protein n=1 Tax=Romanomermis culicivorax TaxID=13658 RepID=A0A915IG85_ROMCU
MERWDVGDSDFWIEFFQNPFKTYDNYIQLPEPFTASLFVILAARVLLHYNIVKLKTNQDILGNILKPFVRSHLAVALQSAPRTEIESLNDKIKSYDSRSRLFLTATDLKWLKECVKSSTFEC